MPEPMDDFIYENSDDTALFSQHIPLVKSIVRRFLHTGIEYDDLYQLGCLGLWKAIHNFDTAFGVKFSTYAFPVIIGEIRCFLRDNSTVHISRNTKAQYTRLLQIQSCLQEQLQRKPTLQELSSAVNIAAEEIPLILESCRPVLSFDTPVGEGSEQTLADTLPAPTDVYATDKLLLKHQLQCLPPRERRILMLRFFADKTQSEIADSIGVSQVQISRILNRTLEKLRQVWRESSC